MGFPEIYKVNFPKQINKYSLIDVRMVIFYTFLSKWNKEIKHLCEIANSYLCQDCNIF